MRQHLLSGKGMRKLGCYLTLILLSIIFLFPLYWFFLNSFKSYEQLFQFPRNFSYGRFGLPTIRRRSAIRHFGLNKC